MESESSILRSHESDTIPILSQINPVHDLPTDFFKIRFDIILRSTSGSSKCSLALRSPHPNPVRASPSPTHATCPAKLTSLYDHPNNIWWEVQIIKLLIMQSPVSSSLLNPNGCILQHLILKAPQCMLTVWIFNSLCWAFVSVLWNWYPLTWRYTHTNLIHLIVPNTRVITGAVRLLSQTPQVWNTAAGDIWG